MINAHSFLGALNDAEVPSFTSTHALFSRYRVVRPLYLKAPIDRRPIWYEAGTIQEPLLVVVPLLVAVIVAP